MNKTHGGIKNPLILLCLFVFIITINSGLMYQVINPAFEHLTGLVSWYWAVPYIAALIFMRNLSSYESKAFQNFVYRDGNDYRSVHQLYADGAKHFRLSDCGYADARRLRYFRPVLVEHPRRNAGV
jgi:hypothetical protein